MPIPAALLPILELLGSRWALPLLFGGQALAKGVTSTYLGSKELNIQKALESMRIKSEAERMKMARRDRQESLDQIRKMRRDRSSRERESMLLQMAEMGRMRQMDMMSNIISSMAQASPSRGYQPLSPMSIPGLLSE